MNTIPSIAIGRIEVLKEGASATCGSEAVSGVANFVTRGDVLGFELNVAHDHFEGVGDTTIGGIWAAGSGLPTASCPPSASADRNCEWKSAPGRWTGTAAGRDAHWDIGLGYSRVRGNFNVPEGYKGPDLPRLTRVRRSRLRGLGRRGPHLSRRHAARASRRHDGGPEALHLLQPVQQRDRVLRPTRTAVPEHAQSGLTFPQWRVPRRHGGA